MRRYYIVFKYLYYLLNILCLYYFLFTGSKIKEEAKEGKRFRGKSKGGKETDQETENGRGKYLGVG